MYHCIVWHRWMLVRCLFVIVNRVFVFVEYQMNSAVSVLMPLYCVVSSMLWNCHKTAVGNVRVSSWRAQTATKATDLAKYLKLAPSLSDKNAVANFRNWIMIVHPLETGPDSSYCPWHMPLSFSLLTQLMYTSAFEPCAGSGVVRMDPLHFLARCRKKATKSGSCLSCLLA